jgi:hypothetical protein
MLRLPLSSRDLAVLRVAEQRAQRPRPVLAPRQPPRGKSGGLKRLLRRLWAWVEQPEAPSPASRPLVTNFYTEL